MTIQRQKEKVQKILDIAMKYLNDPTSVCKFYWNKLAIDCNEQLDDYRRLEELKKRCHIS